MEYERQLRLKNYVGLTIALNIYPTKKGDLISKCSSTFEKFDATWFSSSSVLQQPKPRLSIGLQT